MSFQLMAWASEQKTGSPTRKAVLMALANAANHHTGRCDPGADRIAAETELHERSVRRAFVELEEAGFIRRERKRRADGSYGTFSFVFPHMDTATEPPDRAPGRPADTQAGRPPDRAPGQNLEVLNQEDLNQEVATTANAVVGATTAQQLVGDYVDMVRDDGAEPPKQAVGMIAGRVGQLLKEGQDPSTIWRALQLLHERRLHPAVLPTLIVEAAAGPGRRRTISDLDADYEKLRRGEAL